MFAMMTSAWSNKKNGGRRRCAFRGLVLVVAVQRSDATTAGVHGLAGSATDSSLAQPVVIVRCEESRRGAGTACGAVLVERACATCQQVNIVEAGSRKRCGQQLPRWKET